MNVVFLQHTHLLLKMKCNCSILLDIFNIRQTCPTGFKVTAESGRYSNVPQNVRPRIKGFPTLVRDTKTAATFMPSTSRWGSGSNYSTNCPSFSVTYRSKRSHLSYLLDGGIHGFLQNVTLVCMFWNLSASCWTFGDVSSNTSPEDQTLNSQNIKTSGLAWLMGWSPLISINRLCPLIKQVLKVIHGIWQPVWEKVLATG